jgi:hypothetical protein
MILLAIIMYLIFRTARYTDHILDLHTAVTLSGQWQSQLRLFLPLAHEAHICYSTVSITNET